MSKNSPNFAASLTRKLCPGVWPAANVDEQKKRRAKYLLHCSSLLSRSIALDCVSNKSNVSGIPKRVTLSTQSLASKANQTLRIALANLNESTNSLMATIGHHSESLIRQSEPPRSSRRNNSFEWCRELDQHSVGRQLKY